MLFLYIPILDDLAQCAGEAGLVALLYGYAAI